mgnify:CR=1 FL=1
MVSAIVKILSPVMGPTFVHVAAEFLATVLTQSAIERTSRPSIAHSHGFAANPAKMFFHRAFALDLRCMATSGARDSQLRSSASACSTAAM